MLNRLGLNSSVAELLVGSFTEGTDGVINEIKKEYGLDTGNFKHGGSWDKRFDRIKQVALQNDLVVLTRKRGGIWTFICVLDLNTGSLYIFSKEKNVDTVIKNFGKKKIHYFHAFVSLNSGPLEFNKQQITLFETLTDEYESKRLMEVQRILGEEYPLVKQVIFVIAQEIGNRMVGVEARLYNRYFELVDKVDWSMYVSKDEYSDLVVLDEEFAGKMDIIPKIKLSIKKRKEHFDQGIAKKKLDEEHTKEEDKG
ncbi:MULTISPECIES: DUF5986 family protein [unclassified Paenibacillus]|uniref:DUF5986 family protein n=1 Tax=unclassified Paenibacillus TaxID=185978 RepID=UPI0004906DF7|nr:MULTISPECIES: DUF5986 family protein [unclassified Paenibacillus]SFR27810.1 hypothetical protein SAMN04488603_1206 [Paenibacillus sp. cl130]